MNSDDSSNTTVGTQKIKALRKSFTEKQIKDAVSVLITPESNDILQSIDGLRANTSTLQPIVTHTRHYYNGKMTVQTLATQLAPFAEPIETAVRAHSANIELLDIAAAVNSLLASVDQLAEIDRIPERMGVPQAEYMKVSKGGILI